MYMIGSIAKICLTIKTVVSPNLVITDDQRIVESVVDAEPVKAVRLPQSGIPAIGAAMPANGPNHRILQRTTHIRFVTHRVGSPPSIDALWKAHSPLLSLSMISAVTGMPAQQYP